MAKQKAGASKINENNIAANRKAWHDYEIIEKHEAGLVLQGSEIKSVRAGKVDLRDAYARPENGEMWLYNAHIAPYEAASYMNHDPRRPRKLLLHRDQIRELAAAVQQKGLTIVALRIYFRNHVAKAELGLARGKRQYDKRQTMINRELDMEARRSMAAVRD